MIHKIFSPRVMPGVQVNIIDAKLFTNKVVYYVSSTLGSPMWIASIVMLLTRRSATNADNGIAELP